MDLMTFVRYTNHKKYNIHLVSVLHLFSEKKIKTIKLLLSYTIQLGFLLIHQNNVFRDHYEYD